MSAWRWLGDIQTGTNGQRVATGSGSPEGVITAPVGSLYLRSDGSTNQAVYIKETGAGNTGWTAVGSGGTAITLQHDGSSNSSQGTLNLVSGSGIAVTDIGAGSLSIASSVSGIVIPPLGAKASANGEFLTSLCLTPNIQSAGSVTWLASTASESVSAQFGLTATSIFDYGYGENTSSTSFGNFHQLSTRAKFTTTAPCRYWIGLTNNSAGLILAQATALLSTESPTISVVAFRYSSGVDTVWQAIVGNGSTQTVVNTGVAVDTSHSQLFEIINTGSAYKFYINSTLVATISTNMPTTSDPAYFISTHDNKDASSAITVNNYFYYITTNN